MRPLRVLHVLDSLGRGGVETWLMQLVRNGDRRDIQHDFAVHIEKPGAFEAEAVSLGCTVHRCGAPRPLHTYVASLWRLMRGGKYDVVHGHLMHFNGVILSVARAAGVPGRVAHSHSDSRPTEVDASQVRQGYLSLMGGFIGSSATDVLACSAGAAHALLGERRASPDRYRVVPYGIDLTPFSRARGGHTLRADHGIPDGVPVIGHVGRMSAEKNHMHLLEVAARLLQHRPDVRVVLIGAGYLKPEIIARAGTLGISASVVFPEPATDHLRWMTDVFDAFVFPSLAEGIPLALIETQAAGLPAIISDEAVPREIEIIPSLIHRVSLTAGVDAWVAAIDKAIRDPRMPVAQATALVAASQFNIDTSRLAVEHVYHARVDAKAS